jgi:hypothetical protein
MLILYVWVFWLLLWSVIAFREKEPIISVSYNVACNKPVSTAYATYLNIKDFYLDLSKGHKEYTIIDSNWEQGGKIKVRESAGFQYIEHCYKIKNRVENRLVHLVSPASQSKIFGFIRGTNQSEAIFEFIEKGDGCQIRFKLMILFPSRLKQILALTVLTPIIWKKHAKEEMNNLVRIIETKTR